MKRPESQGSSASTGGPTLRPLVSLLEEEAVVLERLLSLAGSERRATKMRDLEKLEVALAKKRVQLDRLAGIEARRTEFLAGWAADRGLNDRCPTISTLLDHVPPADRSLLVTAQTRLAGLVQSVSEANQANAALLVALLSSIRESFDFIVGIQSREFAYTAGGAHVTAKRSTKRIIERCA